jgi:hypothetical protein
MNSTLYDQNLSIDIIKMPDQPLTATTIEDIDIINDETNRLADPLSSPTRKQTIIITIFSKF